MGYTPHTPEDCRAMLQAIGVETIDALFHDIPDSLKIKGSLNVPMSLDEDAIMRELGNKAGWNCSSEDCVCFCGAGIYDHFIPSLVSAMISRGEFLTAYTPYQPELSQGNLQAIYEYQSLICELTGMDVSNASMYDAGSALAESALMAASINDRTKIIVSKAVHPHYRQCVKTYAWALGLEVVECACSDGVTDLQALMSMLDGNTAAVLVQNPNFFGNIEPMQAITTATQKIGAVSIVSADPISLAILKPPGEYGADIVIGEGQSLGIPMGFGGPLLGIFACKEAYIRRLPGRIVGRTKDKHGKDGYVMTLRTREQDIRREKATSNICTNEALMALSATVFMTAVGKEGLRSMAIASAQKAHYAVKRLTEIAGVNLRYPNSKYFMEFALQLPRTANEVRDILFNEGFLAGLALGDYYPELEDTLLVAVTERRTKEEIDAFAQALQAVV